MPFGIWTKVGPTKHTIDSDDVQIPIRRGDFYGKGHAHLILELCAVITYHVEYVSNFDSSQCSISMQRIKRYGIIV